MAQSISLSYRPSFQQILDHSWSVQKEDARLLGFKSQIVRTCYVARMIRASKGQVPPGFESVMKWLAYYTDDENHRILDFGCGNGRNAIPIALHKFRVTLLDESPLAIEQTLQALRSKRLIRRVDEAFACKICTMPQSTKPFHAVVSQYASSFIPPNLFEETVEERIFPLIEKGGYFVGGFFGTYHAYSRSSNLTFVTAKKIREIFEKNQFMIWDLTETYNSVDNNIIHLIHIIAQKVTSTLLEGTDSE